MNATYVGAAAGLLISVLWITLGFWWTLLIAVVTIVGGVIGHFLQVKGLDSPRQIAIAILNKIAE